jgi:hypothetical protein
MPVVPATWEVEVGGSCFQDNLGKVSLRLYLKIKLKKTNKKSKRTWGMAQVPAILV